MSLKFALLGYLSTAPASGYEIANDFSASLGWFWAASHSQIYPELHRLEEQGLIRGEDRQVGERGRKRVYKPTVKGSAALRRWVGKPVSYRPTRDVERIKLMFLDLGSREGLRMHLEAHAERFEAEVAHWEEQMRMVKTREHPRLRLRLKGKDEEQEALIVFLVRTAIAGTLERARLEVRWAREALNELEALRATAASAPARRSS